jgi:hypothetical protein
MFIISKLYSQSCTGSTTCTNCNSGRCNMYVATGTITVTAPIGAQYTYSIDGTNFQSSPHLIM